MLEGANHPIESFKDVLSHGSALGICLISPLLGTTFTEGYEVQDGLSHITSQTCCAKRENCVPVIDLKSAARITKQAGAVWGSARPPGPQDHMYQRPSASYMSHPGRLSKDFLQQLKTEMMNASGCYQRKMPMKQEAGKEAKTVVEGQKQGAPRGKTRR